MKPHPRIRKTIKWGGLILSPLVAAVWIASAWWSVQIPVRPTLLVSIQSGWYVLSREPTPGGGGSYPFWIERTPAPRLHWSGSISPMPSGWHALIPLWPAALAMSVMTAIAWRIDTLARRRERVGVCPKCSYDRTGLSPGSVCPECGAAAARMG